MAKRKVVRVRKKKKVVRVRRKKKHRALNIEIADLDEYGTGSLKIIAKGKPYETNYQGMRKPTAGQVKEAKRIIRVRKIKKI